MKTVHILALVFISLVFANCSNSKEDSVPPYLYTFHLKFVDADNNNLLENKNLNISIVNFSLAQTSEKDVDKLGINREKINDVPYLKVSIASLPGHRLEKIFFNVKSKELFNDDENHKIETIWQWKNNFDNTPMEIYLDDNNLKSEVVTPSFQYFLVKE